MFHRSITGIMEKASDSKPTRRDSIEITQIMLSIDGWRRTGRVLYTPWGKQKVFEKEPQNPPF